MNFNLEFVREQLRSSPDFQRMVTLGHELDEATIHGSPLRDLPLDVQYRCRLCGLVMLFRRPVDLGATSFWVLSEEIAGFNVQSCEVRSRAIHDASIRRWRKLHDHREKLRANNWGATSGCS